MASIVFGGGITNIIGSHAGNTFSRNKGGAYVKKKTHGTNPRSSNQMNSRTQVGRLAKHYTFLLTDPQRSAWRTFAATNPVVNRLGNTTFLSGQQMFAKVTANLLNGGYAINASPPASTAVGSPTALVIDALSGAGGHLKVQNTVVGFTAFDQITLWASPPMNPGRAFISSQLRRLGNSQAINANNTYNTDYLHNFGLFPGSAGQRVFIRVQVLNGNTGIQSALFQSSALWT